MSKNTLASTHFEILSTLCDENPYNWMSELQSGCEAASEGVLAEMVAAGLIVIEESELGEDGPLVVMTAKGLREFAVANGTYDDGEEVEAITKEHNLK